MKMLYSIPMRQDDEVAPSLKRNARWNSLSPKVQLRIMNEAHDRAIANKKKREPLNDKKRREYYTISLLFLYCDGFRPVLVMSRRLFVVHAFSCSPPCTRSLLLLNHVI